LVAALTVLLKSIALSYEFGMQPNILSHHSWTMILYCPLPIGSFVTLAASFVLELLGLYVSISTLFAV
jgi:hypothetical protein